MFHSVLKYHTIESEWNAQELSDVATIPTSLRSQDARDALSVRLRVDTKFQLNGVLPRVTLTFNSVANVVGDTLVCKNGLIHIVDHGLLPPFSALNELFLDPTRHGIFTSDLQRVDLDRLLRRGAGRPEIPREVMNELIKDAGEEFTIFAPTNAAYEDLRLVLFLLSQPNLPCTDDE